MLDTIRVSIQNVFSGEINSDNGWKPSEEIWYQVYKKVKLENGASIFMQYYFGAHIFVLQFSAAKVQNGTNAVAYDFGRPFVVENAITETIANELGLFINTKDMNVCRVDLNRDFVFKTEDEANCVLDFANKILPVRYEKRFDYETGITSQTKKGNGLRVYSKDKDVHLSKKEREQMPPTVRFEFQMNRKAATRAFGHRPNLHQLLTNRAAAEFAWNRQLDIYGLDKKIVSRKELHKIAIKYLTPAPRETLKQMNDTPSFSDKKQRQKQLAVTRKCKSLGICPYSCEIPFTMEIRVCDTIMKMRKEKRTWNNTANFRPYDNRTIVRDTARSTKWYLDSS